MTARLLTLTLMTVGCTGTEEPTEVATEEVVVEVDCDYAAFAGDWEGVLRQEALAQTVEYDTQLTVLPTSMADEIAGTASDSTDASGSLESCHYELICTGETQVDWRVLRARLLPGGTESCGSGFGFLRPEDDGSLTLEWSPSEFGQRLVTGSMHLVN